jgi:hypothetical protein
MALDRQVRNEAVTMRANVFGHNYKDETEYDLTVGAYTPSGGYSDLCPLIGIRPSDGASVAPTPQAINSIRVLQPHQGELVECYIDALSIRTATNALGGTLEVTGLGLMVVVGEFTNNNFLTPKTNYTFEEIKEKWEKINGSHIPLRLLSGGGDWRIMESRIKIHEALHKSDSPYFVEDGFNLLFAFTDYDGTMLRTPVATGAGSNFNLEMLRIVQSMSGVV